ncbi:hypothetical protein B0H34DRAFT_663392 [Crassisporium funariophilum]|nr:hypothetical protein B0H34DRAFT_663392 [Crassisporium funariophilum]
MTRSVDLHKSPSTSNFQIERSKSPGLYGRPNIPQADPTYQNELVYREHVAALIAAKDRQFAISGHIPVDPAHLVLFFRSKTGITHSLDFPIDIGYNTPPAFDVLVAACRPHQTSDFDDYSDREALFYPPNLPLTSSIEIANYPILDAVRSSLFPTLPKGSYLTAVKDRLDVVGNGSRLISQSPALLRNDGRSATIIITLPVRFRGGTQVIRDPLGNEERFHATGGKTGDIEWMAFMADCECEIETVKKGCCLTISYGVFIKEYGTNAETLVIPTDKFFDLLSPILNMSRGRSIAFYLNYDYGVNPAEVTANTLVPQLKGADSLIYDAFKFHKLSPELHWTAGGYVWPMDRTLEFFGEDIASPNPLKSGAAVGRTPFTSLNGPRGAGIVPPVRGAFGTYGGPAEPNYHEGEVDAIRTRVEASGAVALADANITILQDFNNLAPVVGRERVYFVSNGELEKLVVNVIVVVYIA